VLVFYDDGERPQRHSLADCARLRASTIGRTDIPHHNDLPEGWREEKAVGSYGQPKTSGIHDLAICPEDLAIEDLKPLNSQHILSDCIVEDVNEATLVKHHRELHSLEDCTADAETNSSLAAEPAVDNPSSVQQHVLKDCAIDAIPGASSPKPAKEVSPHSLSKCREEDSERGPVESDTLDQHEIADCAVNNARSAHQPSLGHRLRHCNQRYSI